VTILGWPEQEVWFMTLHKIVALFSVHKEFNKDRFKQDLPQGLADIDDVLGGL